MLVKNRQTDFVTQPYSTWVDRQTDRQSDRQRGKTGRQTGRQRDGQTGRQAGGQVDSEIESLQLVEQSKPQVADDRCRCRDSRVERRIVGGCCD
jgi:hypothetical protein